MGGSFVLKQLMREALQEVLEAEMSEALGAGLGERREGRRGIAPRTTAGAWSPRIRDA